ncbi:hypothetical protein MP228_012026 [Amoeboaphelidium protococcarum]|nr:hypothetical protein MP228_012026 [Amoeboaphelidium protococcarum]
MSKIENYRETLRASAITYFGAVVVIIGLGGAIGHAVAYDSQVYYLQNTYISSWYAAIFGLLGLNILHLVPRQSNQLFFSRATQVFNVLFIAWCVCSLVIGVVCYGLVKDWSPFLWSLSALFVCGVSVLQLIRSIEGSDVDSLNITQYPLQLKLLSAFVITIQVITIFISGCLSAGAISAAYANSFTPPGRAISVYFEGINRNVTVQLNCIGTPSPSLPTVFLFSSPAHGIVDFYGLQYYLSSYNGTDRRVCTFDPPGFGWSTEVNRGQDSSFEHSYQIMKTSGESAPWHVVGWGAGGSTVAYLASKHPSDIKSATFLESYPQGIEFDYYGVYQSLDQNQVSAYASSQIVQRLGLSKLIISLAIPWGLMSLFVPIQPQDPNYYPAEKWTELKVQSWKSKMWMSQLEGLLQQQKTAPQDDPMVKFAPLPSNVPVFGVYCNVTQSCLRGSRNLTGQACDDQIKQNLYYNDRKFTMVRSLSANATIVTNNDLNCTLSLPVVKPKFTAESLAALYSNRNL